MRKLIFGGLTALTLLAGSYAAASNLEIDSVDSAQAQQSELEWQNCQGISPLDVEFVMESSVSMTTKNPNLGWADGNRLVEEIQVSNINEACVGETLVLEFTTDGVAITPTLLSTVITGTSETISIDKSATRMLVSDVNGVRAAIVDQLAGS